MVKLVIFDLDGTLVDAYKAVAESLNYTLVQLGHKPVEDTAIKRAVGWGDRNLIKAFLGTEDLDAALSIFRQHHSRALKHGTVFLPGARSVLEDLKVRRYILAIASNRPSRFTRIILKHLKAASLFDHVLCADQVKQPKPEADLLCQLLKQSGLLPEETIYVGDMTVDVETGQRAQVRTVAVATGSSTKKELSVLKPYKIIDRISDVIGVIDELQGNAV